MGISFLFSFAFTFLFTAIYNASSDIHFAVLHFFSLGMFLLPVFCTMSRTSIHSSSGTQLANLITWTTALSNSVKLSHTLGCGATQNGQIMVERSDRTWSTGEGNGKPLQYSWLENPMNSMKWQKDRTMKDELPRSVGAPYATGDQWRNSSRKNDVMEPKQKQHPVVDGTGDRSKIQCCKEKSA